MEIQIKKMPTVDELFKEGWKHAFRPYAPPPDGSVQHIECERFFKSGFRACLLLQLNGIANLPDEQGILVLEKWMTELETYFKTATSEKQN